jgi:hypothetical protein
MRGCIEDVETRMSRGFVRWSHDRMTRGSLRDTAGNHRLWRDGSVSSPDQQTSLILRPILSYGNNIVSFAFHLQTVVERTASWTLEAQRDPRCKILRDETLSVPLCN